MKKSFKPLKRSPLKRKPKNQLSKLKHEADKWFSLYIRNFFPPKCYTCGKVSEPKKLQCGHFIARHHSATRFSEDNCRPQCVGCNVWGRGQAGLFAAHLIEELGDEKFKALLKLGNSIHQFTCSELEQLADTYRVKVEGLH